MGRIILYSLGDENSKETEKLLKEAGVDFEIQEHLFNDYDEPVIRLTSGNLVTGMYEIRIFFGKGK